MPEHCRGKPKIPVNKKMAVVPKPVVKKVAVAVRKVKRTSSSSSSTSKSTAFSFQAAARKANQKRNGSKVSKPRSKVAAPTKRKASSLSTAPALSGKKIRAKTIILKGKAKPKNKKK